MLPLGDPVDLAAIAADDALIDALSGDVLAELLADDVLIEALVARMPLGTAPPRSDVLAGLLAELLAAWVAEARGYRPPPLGCTPVTRRTFRNSPDTGA